MEQIVGEKAHFQPGFVRREPVAACFVPAQRVLTFLDPVLNIIQNSHILHEILTRSDSAFVTEIVNGIERYSTGD